MTIRVFPEPDRYYRVSIAGDGAFVGKLLAVNWLVSRPLTGFAAEERIRPETLVFDVSKGWEKGEEKYRQRIVRWEAIAWVEEAESYEQYGDG